MQLSAISFGQFPSQIPVYITVISDAPVGTYLTLERKNHSLDTLRKTKGGCYVLTTRTFDEGEEVSLRGLDYFSPNLFIAPGYNLTVFISKKNDFKIHKITGKGSLASNYNLTVDSFNRAKKRSYGTSLEGRRFAIKQDFIIRDSILKSTFARSDSFDKAIASFYKRATLENDFAKLLAFFSLKRSLNLDYKGMDDLLHSEFNDHFFANIVSDDYLISEAYRDAVSGPYLNHLLERDYAVDSSLQEDEDYKFEKIDSVYFGKVKDFVVAETIRRKFFWAKDIDELESYKTRYEKYLKSISDHAVAEELNILIYARQSQLTKLGIGRRAPSFTLPDQFGRRHSLDNFHGKLVYIDFWASWCVPCRKQTPYLKIVYEKFKGNDNIAFISIAVSDKKANWLNTLAHDKPKWLQLFDDEGSVNSAYSTNEIPKFVLINRDGEIISLNAPSPSDTKLLEEIIDTEIKKGKM